MCIQSVGYNKVFGEHGYVDFPCATSTMYEKCKSRALKTSVRAPKKLDARVGSAKAERLSS